MFEPIPAASVSRSKPRTRTAASRKGPDADDVEEAAWPPSVTKSPAVLLSKRGLRVGRTRVGKGLFTTKRFVDGTCIGQIEGQIIRDENYVSRYAFDLNNGLQLEPDAPFRFVNHSCEPNCAFECFTFPSRGRESAARAAAVPNGPPIAISKLLLFAICDIAIGQELTIDYNWPAVFAIPCGCRSVNCRGWIVDAAELPKLLRDRSNRLLPRHPA